MNEEATPLLDKMHNAALNWPSYVAEFLAIYAPEIAKLEQENRDLRAAIREAPFDWRDNTLADIEAAIIVSTGNGELATHTVRFLEKMAALTEGENVCGDPNCYCPADPCIHRTEGEE
jgi:hypothetical protein